MARYREMIKRSTLDNSGTQAKKDVDKLLNGGGYTVEQLCLCVDRYREFCEATEAGPRFRKNCGNFFGREAVFEAYLADDWQPPPKARGRPRGDVTNPVAPADKYDGVAINRRAEKGMADA